VATETAVNPNTVSTKQEQLFPDAKTIPTPPPHARNPQSRVVKIHGDFAEPFTRKLNAFRRDTVALSRHADTPKDNAEPLTGCIGVLKSDVDALSRDLGAQKGIADAEKGNADVQKNKAEAQKINADGEKINAGAKKNQR
jgi:hypothetical protein